MTFNRPRLRAPVVALAVSLMVGPGMTNAPPVVAAQPSTNAVEQHWELLAQTETVPSTSPFKDIEIRRGDLPEAATKFEPAPTVTLEVVGKHTGGQGNSKWDVSFLWGSTSSTVLATIPGGFPNHPDPQLKTASFAWPSTARPIRMIRVTRVNDGLQFAGSFELQKVYLKIRQTGLIKKTAGRVPLAAKQTAIAWTSWQDLNDVVLYTHRAADFSPAPAIYLRSTGIETTSNQIIQSLHVRLVDSAGQEVPGSANLHTGLASVQSSALDLEDGETYHLQAMVTSALQSGDLYSADLVFEQATTSVDGLSRTVGWFPSVTAGTSVSSPSDLGFFQRAPDISTPEARRTWSYSAKRTGGTGSLKIDLRDVTADEIAASTPLGVQESAFKSRAVDNINPISASNVLDSRPDVSSGTTGRVSSSVLRVAMDLHTASAPVLSLAASEAAFSPNADGIKDWTLISFSVDDVTLEEWSLVIRNEEEVIVFEYEPVVEDPVADQFYWFGEDSQTLGFHPDGEYTVELTALDAASHTAGESLSVVIDTLAPSVRVWDVTPGLNAVVIEPAPRLKMRVSEPRPYSVEWTVVDLTANLSHIVPLSATYVSGVWAWSDPWPTIVGHQYQVHAIITDDVGNTATVAPSSGTVSFTRVEWAIEDALASVEPIECALGEPGPDNMRSATCDGAVLQVTNTVAQLSQSGHAGMLSAATEVDLGSMEIINPEQPTLPAVAVYDSPAPHEDVLLRGEVADMNGPITIPLSNSPQTLREVTVAVPATWNRAQLRMEPAGVEPQILSCNEPPMVVQPCSADVVQRANSLIFSTPLSPAQLMQLPPSSLRSEVVVTWVPDRDRSMTSGHFIDEVSSESLATIGDRVHLNAAHLLASADDESNEEDGDYFESVLDETAPFRVVRIGVHDAPSTVAALWLEEARAIFGGDLEFPLADPAWWKASDVACNEWEPNRYRWYFDKEYWPDLRVSPPPDPTPGMIMYRYEMDAMWNQGRFDNSVYKNNSGSGYEISGILTIDGTANGKARCYYTGSCLVKEYDWYSELPGAYLGDLTADDDVTQLEVGGDAMDKLQEKGLIGEFARSGVLFEAPIDYADPDNHEYYGKITSYLSNQVDIDMPCSGRGDICFWSNAGYQATNARDFPIHMRGPLKVGFANTCGVRE